VPPESILLPISTHLKHFLNKRQPKLQVNLDSQPMLLVFPTPYVLSKRREDSDLVMKLMNGQLNIRVGRPSKSMLVLGSGIKLGKRNSVKNVGTVLCRFWKS
jgi:hypothetical protein